MNIVLRHRRKLSILFTSLLCSPCSYAINELGKINLELSVEVVTFTCGISIDQNNKMVELGSWSNQRFKNKGDTSPEQVFEYRISDCPAIASVNFRFSGPKDPQDPELLAIDKNALAAQNIAIEILDSDKKRLALNTASPKIKLDKDGNGLAQFYARYRATTAAPRAGKANATATFTIQYD